MQNAVRSGMGLLGMHPSASLSHPLPGQRMPGLLPLDLRPNLLQGAGARFPMLMQQGLAQQANSLLDASLQARARAPFPQMEHFNRPDGPFVRAPNPTAPPLDNMDKVNNSNNTPTAPDSGGQQEGDQDYRFPLPEKPSTGLLRTPPPEMRTEPTPIRAPLLERPPRGGVHTEGREGPGRREPMPGPFRAETRWGAPRGDLDERDMRGMPAGPPKGFQEDRGNPNFQNRFDMRGGGSGGAMGGVGPGWNRGAGVGGGGGPFNPNMHQDFDDRRRPWERQKDRDDRDFRRDMNDSRHRERDREWERDRERGRDRNRERDRERDSEKERDRERGGWAPLNPQPQPQPLLPLPRPSQPLLPLPTSLLNLPPSQPEPHPKPLLQHESQSSSRQAESQPDVKPPPLQPQPEKERAGGQEKKDAFSDGVHDLDSKPETDMRPTAEPPHPSLSAPTAGAPNETQAPEAPSSPLVAAGGGQTAAKEEAETGTEPELVKTDTEET